MIVKYLLRINTDKYPEVLEALETAKKKEGIAAYVRALVINDVEQKKRGASIAPLEAVATVVEPTITEPQFRTPVEPVELNYTIKVADEDESINDFGGGLA